MKALSVKQPWAWLIANGYKTIETRVWPTDHRGDLLIVASKGKMKKADEADFLAAYPTSAGDLLYGQAVCVASVVDCRPMTADDEPAACCGIYDGAFAWVLSDVRKVQPFGVKGKLKLYEVTLPVINSDERQYELHERIAILLENNPEMSAEQARLQATVEIKKRKVV